MNQLKPNFIRYFTILREKEIALNVLFYASVSFDRTQLIRIEYGLRLNREKICRTSVNKD